MRINYGIGVDKYGNGMEFFFFEDATLEADCQPLGGGGPGQEQGQVGENTVRPELRRSSS